MREGKCITLKAWLKCTVIDGKTKQDSKITVESTVHNDDKTPHSVSYYVPKDRIHPSGAAVLVVVFRDHQGFWVRFPTNSPYKPFRVAKSQLRKAGGANKND